MDIQKQKAQLQTIVKTAHVYQDGRIEVEVKVVLGKVVDKQNT